MNIATIWIQTKISRIMNIPQGYKQTELGIIPEDWEVVPLSSLCRLYGRIGFRGYTKADLVHKGEGAITFSPSDIINQQVTYSDCDYISWQKYHESPEIKVRQGDIIFCKTASIGKCAFIRTLPEKATINPQFVVLKDFKCFNEWLYYQLIDWRFQQTINGITGGSTIPTMSQEKLYSQLIACPMDIAEQRAIAEALSDVDGLIAVLDKKIAKNRLFKQGAMQQLLTSKKRLPVFTDKWKYVALEHLLEYEQPTKYLVQSADYIESGTPVLTAGKTFVLGYTAENKGIYTNLPVIIFDDFTTDSKYVTMPFKAKSSAMKMLQLKDRRYNLRLVYELMQLIQFPLYDHQRYWISEYSKLQVYIPSNFKEQQAIATILSDMDKEIADLEAQRDKYRLLKSGMMQKLLTGQIRLVKQQAKIIPLGVEVPAVRDIPIDAHIIAGHIVNRSHQSRGWGRTKLQKSLHLIGYCAQLNLGNEYIRNTAGPDDQQLMNYIDQKFRQYRHVNKVCEKLPDGKTHYSYTPTPMIQDVEMAYEKYPKELREQVDALIDKLNTMDLAGAEILSTLYAVWNNRIIKQEQITDDLLIADFYAWSTHKADFEEARVRKVLNYMRSEGITPTGWDKYIDKK